MSDRLAEYGPLIDAGAAREHVTYLRSKGLSVDSIARFSGVSPKSLASLVWGIEGRPPSSKVRQDTADRIFSVRPRVDLLKPTCAVDATGTRRRLQALQVLGWSPGLLSAQLSMSHTYVNRVCRGELTQVRVFTAQSVRALYERLWDKQPPQAGQYQQMAVTRIRRKAARNGWAPPMAWDDATINDPKAIPEGVGTVAPQRGKLPPPDEIAWLVAGGDSIEVLADRYGATVDGVKQRLHRAKAAAA